MKKNITIPVEDAWRIYELLEELNDFLHQPMNYAESAKVHSWLLEKGVSPELRDVFYGIVRHWFPVNEETGIVDPPPGASSIWGRE